MNSLVLALTGSVVGTVEGLRTVRLASPVVEEAVPVPRRCMPGSYSKEDASPIASVNFDLWRPAAAGGGLAGEGITYNALFISCSSNRCISGGQRCSTEPPQSRHSCIVWSSPLLLSWLFLSFCSFPSNTLSAGSLLYAASSYR